MKTSAVLASILFGSYAVAAPFDRRALVYKTEVVTETVVVYTTVWDDQPVAEPTTTSAGEFYEKPSKPSTTSTAVVVSSSSSAVATPLAAPSKAAPTSSKATPAYTPVVPEEPSSAYTPVETPTSVYTPVPTTPAPAPESSYVAPAPAPEPTTTKVASPAPEPVYSQAPAPSSAAPSYPTTGGTSSGVAHSGVEMTIYNPAGAYGACGKELSDTDKVIAISIGAWNAQGGTIHDLMTGESTNPWCGKTVEIEFQGQTAQAQIMDMCPGCKNAYDIDLSPAVWKELGLTEITRYHGVNWKIV